MEEVWKPVDGFMAFTINRNKKNEKRREYSKFKTVLLWMRYSLIGINVLEIERTLAIDYCKKSNGPKKFQANQKKFQG